MSSLSSLGVKNALANHVFDTFPEVNEALPGKGALLRSAAMGSGEPARPAVARLVENAATVIRV
ncbi:MAG TPA: hypothetical protein VHI97_03125, partial [Actinomycetota bacterium]|nr:hypothetical protein [Actinomycetota bacterium]